MTSTDKTRRAKCDAEKRKKGLFKPSIWVLESNVDALRQIADALQSPAAVSITKAKNGKTTITIKSAN